jgi:hypothetical protein
MLRSAKAARKSSANGKTSRLSGPQPRELLEFRVAGQYPNN